MEIERAVRNLKGSYRLATRYDKQDAMVLASPVFVFMRLELRPFPHPLCRSTGEKTDY